MREEVNTAGHSKMRAGKVLFCLVLNAIRFRYLRLTGKPVSPQAISIEITHDCIARCIMCNIWKIPSQVPNLPVNDWLTMLKSPLLSDLRELDVTGGEPFLRDDLSDFFRGLCEIKHGHLKKLKAVAVTTNGFLTKRVVGMTKEIVAMLARENIELVMVCAMDAAGPVHDRVRNVQHAWLKLNATLKGLTGLRRQYPNLIIGVKTTVLPMNIHELDGIVDYANANRFFTIISPCIITGGRYLNTDLTQNLAFGDKDKAAMIGFFRGAPSGWSYHSQRLIDYLSTGHMKKPCTCGFNYFFVRSDGDLHLCPLLGQSVGNILHLPPEKLYFSTGSNRIRKKIGKFDQCGHCTEPGLERFSLPLEGFHYLSLLYKIGLPAFLSFHQHMGLDKYID